MLVLRKLKGLGNDEIREGMHGELPEVALEITGPEYTENRLRTTRDEGLEKVGRRWVSQKCEKVVAGLGYKGGVVVCNVRVALERVNPREIRPYDMRKSSRPRHGP